MQIVDGKEYIPQVRDLILEYADCLGRDLSFQNIEDELKNPAKKYTAPEGAMPRAPAIPARLNISAWTSTQAHAYST